MTWPVLRLEQLASEEPGSIKIGPFGSQLKRSELVTQGIHVIGIENVLANEFDGLGDRFITQEKFETLRSVEVKPGDVMITMMGTIGEVAIVPDGIMPSIMDSHLLRFRPNLSLCLPEYLRWLIKGSTTTRGALHGSAHGAIMKGLNSGIIRSLPAPLPPLAEQRRIVEILDQADALRRQRAEADAKAARILPALFYQMFGDPVTNPMGWPVHLIASVGEVQGGLQLTPKRSNYSLRRPYLRVANVQRGRLVLNEIKTIGLTGDEFKKTRLGAGDLLLVEGNGNPAEIGRAAIWDGSVTDCVHQNHLIRVRCNVDAMTPEFVQTFINSPAGKRYFLSFGNTTSGLVTISTRTVGNCPVPLPPISAQREFSTIVAEINRTQGRLLASGGQLDTLFQTLLHRAFAGDLTARWREEHLGGQLAEVERE